MPETEVERDDGMRTRLRQLQLRMEEIHSLPISQDISLEANFEIKDEVIAMMEKMAAGGNGTAILGLTEYLSASYQFASLTDQVTGRSRRKNYREKALMMGQSLGKKRLEELETKIRAVDELVERIRLAKESLRQNIVNRAKL